jgi:hypothetical protein
MSATIIDMCRRLAKDNEYKTMSHSYKLSMSEFWRGLACTFYL